MNNEDNVYCAFCGSKLIAGSVFCDKCGKRVADQVDDSSFFEGTDEGVIVLQRDRMRRKMVIYQFGDLVLTTKELQFIQKGMFLGATKKVIRYPINTISRAMVAQNEGTGEWKLVVYHSGGQEEFVFPEHIYKEVKVWALAIMDRFSKDAYLYDRDFYLQFIDPNFAKTLREEDELENGCLNNDRLHDYRVNEIDEDDDEDDDGIDGRFIGDVAKSMLTSGFSPMGIRKGIKKAKKKQTERRYESMSTRREIKSEPLIFYYDNPNYIDFKEMGNVFRESFGRDKKLTKMDQLVEAIDRTFGREVCYR